MDSTHFDSGNLPQDKADDLPASVASLNEQAERCRRLAAGVMDRQASEVLRKMADRYEDSAARLNG